MSHKQKQKAKTKKQLKKAVNRLYEALTAEKEKHSKASRMVGQMKHTLERSANMLKAMAQANLNHIHENRDLARDNDKTLDVSAELIKRIA